MITSKHHLDIAYLFTNHSGQVHHHPAAPPSCVTEVKNPVDPYAARGNVELWLVEVEVRVSAGQGGRA